MFLHRVNGFWTTKNIKRIIEQRLENRIDQQRQTASVIHVGMGQKNVADLPHLIEREVADTGPGINQYFIVDEDGGGSEPGANSSAAAQYLDLHTFYSAAYGPGKAKIDVITTT